MMIIRQAGLPAAAVAAVLATGCLQEDAAHTLYLSPGGDVAWTAVQDDVRSDASDRGARLSEEQAYLAAAAGGRHTIGLALEAMGPVAPVRTRIIRDAAPFFVITEARFASIADVMRRLLDDPAGSVSADLSTDGTRSTLKIELDFGVDLPEQDSPAGAILADLEDLRIILTEGRFVSAIGFDLAGDRVATFSAEWLTHAEQVYDAKGRIEMTLIWDTGPV